MHIRHDVIHQNEVRRSGLTTADKTRNDAINDLGLSYMERSAAIDAIAGHHGMTSAQRDELAQRSDSYLTERERLILGQAPGRNERLDRRDHGANMRPTAPRGDVAEVRGDAAEAERAWHRSVANLNARYDQTEDRSVPPTAPRGHDRRVRGDAAEAEHAWHRSVASLNARYDRS